ncbi:MAG: glycosyltransferase family 4 protein [Clostridia bacterium]|nr:glycosyltransferase family 4 protein [Clostridia bacterium]
MDKEIFLVEDGGFGGWALHAFVICTALKEQGIDVHLLTNKEYEFDSFEKNFKVSKIFEPIKKREKQSKAVWLLNRFYVYYTNTKKLLDFLKDKSNYIVHFYSSNYFLNGPANSLLPRDVKVVSNIHDVEPHYNKGTYYMKLQGFLTRKALVRANKLIVFTNEGVRELLQKTGGEKKVAFVEHGQVYLPGAFSKTQAAEYKPSSKLRCLCFGSLRPNKGFEVLLQSVAEMNDAEKQMLEVKIVGQAEDPSYYNTLAGFLKDNGLETCVDLQNRYVDISEIHTCFKDIDLVILPYTHFHSQSGVIYLAHSFGIPVLVTDLAGLKEHIEKTSAGFMVRHSDAHSLKNELVRIASEPSQLVEKREYVKKYMKTALDGWKLISREYQKIYESV